MNHPQYKFYSALVGERLSYWHIIIFSFYSVCLTLLLYRIKHYGFIYYESVMISILFIIWIMTHFLLLVCLRPPPFDNYLYTPMGEFRKFKKNIP